MNDLNTLLDRAAGPVSHHAPLDVGADLARARHALSRTRRRRGAAGLAGVAALGVVGVGIGRATGSHPGTPVAGQGSTDGRATDEGTVDETAPPPQPTTVGAFTFDQVPEGYVAQLDAPPGDGVKDSLGTNLVTFATAGFPDQYPADFEGKLVVMFNEPEFGTFGTEQEYDGRTFWVATDGGGGASQVYVRTRPGEPQGVLEVQYPNDTGWTQDQMIAFTDGIHLGPGATPSSMG